MAAEEKYYSFEKGRYGGPCGAIFPFFRELNGTSALGDDYKNYIPAGYLKCRGQILAADQYPNLARVLGVGSSCIFRKEGTTLSEKNDDGTGGTFQLPDLGSKYIVANSNAGTYSNIDVINPSTNTLTQRAGVEITLEAQTPTVTFPYQGSFQVPGRGLTVVGNIQILSPPTATPEDTISIGQFLAHGHNSDLKIARRINFRNDSTNGASFKANYICKNTSKPCQADAEFGLAHKVVSVEETGSATATKHKHYGASPKKQNETKTASVAATLLDSGSINTTVTVNVANTYKADDIAPKFILCEFLIKF
jgi:microcystin-dependent protein